MTVRTILKTKGNRVVTVGTKSTIDQVVAVLARERIGTVVVSDDGHTAKGILSERDIIQGLSEHGAELLTCTADRLMTRTITPAKMDMSLLHVLDQMTQGRFRHMPVIDDGRLCGIVSIGDAVKARLEMLEAEANHLKEYISGR